VLQPFGVNLLGKTVYQDMRRMEELFRNSNHHNTIAKPNGACGDSCSASARSNAARASTHPPAVSAEYPWARAAHPSPRQFRTCLRITSLLILVGLLRRLCRRLRLVLRRGQVELGKPANTAISAWASAADRPRATAGVGRTAGNLPANSALVYDERCPMGEGVV
jgi:hypothetical protein